MGGPSAWLLVGHPCDKTSCQMASWWEYMQKGDITRWDRKAERPVRVHQLLVFYNHPRCHENHHNPFQKQPPSDLPLAASSESSPSLITILGTKLSTHEPLVDTLKSYPNHTVTSVANKNYIFTTPTVFLISQFTFLYCVPYSKIL